MDQVLSEFHPALSTWFTRRFVAGPTRPQAQGWPVIRRGHDTLIAAPTGSGKTLSAFLVCIDRLYREAQTRVAPGAGVRIVYVSPLKALTVDIEHNLGRPLNEIASVARELGFEVPVLRTRVRSGDSAAKDRAAIVREPPEFLITTPESLYLMLTAERSRGLFASVESVIVDEIHALARDKRGSHLALSLERLDRLCRKRPQRIGLSATQRPLHKVAELLVGYEAGRPRACEIVDTGHQRELELTLMLPDRELEAVASGAHMQEVVSKLCEAIEQRRTTLVFVNTRRLAERLAHNLAERLGTDSVAAHHGSLSKERRQRVEQRLREGSLRALVATASLELGIDVGDVELVCQVGSPRSIATFLQRVGRSGHTRFGKPVGQLYPLTRDELLECTALLRAVSHGELDCLTIPEAPLDILAQQVVAECAAAEHTERELFDWIRRASPFARVSETDFERVLQLMSEGIDTGRGRRAAFLHRDRVQGRVSARRGARLAALTSGGAIPENADYRVIADPEETFVGTINEDFALESAAGDVFLLGSTSWRVRRVERGVVRVTDAQGSAPTLPFWLGEAPGRTHELSQQVSSLRRMAQQALVRGGEEALQAELAAWPGLAGAACGELTRYLGAGYRALGVLPNDRDLVFERFFDDTGGMQVVVHAPLGARINRALGLLLRKRFCRSFDFELQAAASDDAIVLSLGPQHSFPLEDMQDYLQPRGVREALTKAVLQIPMFQVRWRWNLNRALVVLRFRGGRRVAPMIQRMESDDITAAVFPALSACQDNGPIALEPPDHVLVQQTLHDCLTEALDIDGLEQVLAQISAGEVRVHFRDTTEPSPLSHEILSARPYTFLDDAPLEERRTRAVSVPRQLNGDARGPGELDPAAIARVEAEVRPDPRTADELHDLLCGLGVTRPLEAFQSLFEELVRAGRALHVGFDAQMLWGATESREGLEALFPHASFEPDYRLTPASRQDPQPAV
ncbi:MAG TPA: DEAD/DEAH box helicase, partial [Polyangiaceae bacterium]|nr:DEAD/DEAH box helicase [Polyangiaceae bacterium]